MRLPKFFSSGSVDRIAFTEPFGIEELPGWTENGHGSDKNSWLPVVIGLFKFKLQYSVYWDQTRSH